MKNRILVVEDDPDVRRTPGLLAAQTEGFEGRTSLTTLEGRGFMLKAAKNLPEGAVTPGDIHLGSKK